MLSEVAYRPTLLLHALEELKKNLRARTNEDLTLTALFSVGNSLKSVSKNIHQHGDSKQN